MPHLPNSIPALSLHPILNNITNASSHVCLTLITGSGSSWLSSDSLYSHLDRERCVWEFTKWLPVATLLEQCGGQRSDNTIAAVSSITVSVYSAQVQYGSNAVIEQLIVGQINYSSSENTLFLPPPLHTLATNRRSDTYVYPIAVQNTTTGIQVYLYTMAPLRGDGQTFAASNATNLSLLHSDYTTNTSKQVWRLGVGRTLPSDISVEFQLPCEEAECNSTNETLTFPLAMSSEGGKYRAALRASVTLWHSPELPNNYTETFTLGKTFTMIGSNNGVMTSS